VVTSAVCGHAELLGDAAVLVDRADDAEGFAHALDALADGAVRAKLGRLARERVEALDWSAIVDRLRAHYVRIAASKQRAPGRGR
jgi:glycosyltransferase involved in cell wall biosynthesis